MSVNTPVVIDMASTVIPEKSDQADPRAGHGQGEGRHSYETASDAVRKTISNYISIVTLCGMHGSHIYIRYYNSLMREYILQTNIDYLFYLLFHNTVFLCFSAGQEVLYNTFNIILFSHKQSKINKGRQIVISCLYSQQNLLIQNLLYVSLFLHHSIWHF
jgi:hypothetical protein